MPSFRLTLISGLISAAYAGQALAQDSAAAAPAATPASAAAVAPHQPASSRSAAKAGESDVAEVQRVDVLGLGAAIGFSSTRANVKITQEDLDHYPPGVSGDKILERVSGIQQGSSSAFGGSTFDATINMRGFEKDSIGFSVDGIPNGRTTLGGGAVPSRFFDSSNLASVDVSQSAGQIGAPTNQALAGQINYITADPTEKFGARAEVGVGSANSARAYALINTGEFAPGLSAYVSASRSHSTVSYVRNPSGLNTLGHVDIKLVKDFDNGAQAKFKYSYNSINETSAANVVTLPQFKANPTSDGFTDTWTGVAAKDVNYRAFYGNPREDQMTYLSLYVPVAKGGLDVKVYNALQNGYGKFANLGSTYTGLNSNASSIFFRANQYVTNRNGALAELSGGDGRLLDWKVGAWLERYNYNQQRNFYKVLNPAQGDAASSTSSLNSSLLYWHDGTELVYASNTSNLFDSKLKINYGVSYLASSVDFTAPIYSNTSANPASNKFNYTNRVRENSGLLPKVGLLYRLTPATQIFAGYAKNAASINDANVQANATPATAANSPATRMDSSNSFDLGIRQKGETYSVGLQAFVINATQTFAAGIPVSLTVANVPQARDVKGVELNYKQAIRDWTIFGAATLQQCRYDLSNAKANGFPPTGFIKNDSACVGIADKNLFSELSYHPGNALKMAANVRVRSGWAGYYANPNVAGSGTDDHIAGSWLFGLNGSYKFNKQAVGLNLENVFNRRYISGLAPEVEAVSSASGRYFIGAPRSFYLWYRLDV